MNAENGTTPPQAVPDPAGFPPMPLLPAPPPDLDEGPPSASAPTPWRAHVSIAALAAAELRDYDVYGFSVHAGVLVCWDCDLDDRVLTWLAELPSAVRALLRVAYEHQGMLSLVWRYGCSIPPEYAEGQCVGLAGDVWTIGVSVNEPGAVEADWDPDDDFYWPGAHDLGVFCVEHRTTPERALDRAVWTGTRWVLPDNRGTCSTAKLVAHGYVGVRRTFAGAPLDH